MKRVFAIMLILFACGCSTVVDYASMSNDGLFAAGQEFMDDKQYSRSAEMYHYIILNADNPANAQVAQKLLGDSYFLDGSYPEAIAAYEIYYEMYRQSPELPYIIYMLGVAYSNVADGRSRDTGSAQKALDYFAELQARFPQQYAQYQAAVHSQLMLNKLSDYEYRVAEYYIRIDEYEPAMARLVYLINNYPGAPVEEEAYVLLVESALELEGRKELASIYLAELQRLYPDNDEISSLQKQINKM